MRLSREEALTLGVPKALLPPKERRRAPREREGDEQADLVDRFRRIAPPDIGPLLIAIPNGGSRRNRFEGFRLKAQGVRAGVSDLLLPVARGGFHGFWLEFKAAKPFHCAVSADQRTWLGLMRAQGYEAAVCYGPDEALAALLAYLALPAA